nr:hypothetical protein [Pseudoalteromonas sp. WY3]
MTNLNDRGRDTAFPGRSRTLIGETDGAGNDSWAWGTPLYHSAGEDTITFSGCSELLNIDGTLLGEQMNFKASVGYAAYQSGVFTETDSVTGSTVFGMQPQVAFTSLETGEAVTTLKPGEKAVVTASGPFALTQASGLGVVKVMAAADLEVPDVSAPALVGGEFTVSEDAANGTVVGALTVTESEFDLAISEYFVQSNTHQGLGVDADGQVVVTNTALLTGDSSAQIQVVAIDTRGNVSEPAMVTVSITKVVPPPVVVTPEPEKKSSGSLAWLLLTAPLAFMRRRKQK